jgi:hypothetical protein
MKTDKDVRSALVRYMRRPDAMLKDIANMPHEELVIFTMQLLNVSNVERDLIQRIAQQIDSPQHLDDDDDDARRRTSSNQDTDLLSMSPQEGLCDVSGLHDLAPPALAIGARPSAFTSPPRTTASSDVVKSVSGGVSMMSVPADVPPSALSPEEDDDSTQDPVMWKLNLLAHIGEQEANARVGGDAWGED